MEAQPCPPSSSEAVRKEVVRKSVDYHPSLWGDYFINFNPLPPAQMDSLKLRIEEHKSEVLRMFKDTMEPLQLMEFIDTIQRLGVAYHFEKEIDKILCKIHKMDGVNHDLYAVALRFRLLRQQRYYVSSDVFNNFLDEKGDFLDCLSTNELAMLSLYDAAHLLMPDEEILEKAIKFTKLHLSSKRMGLPLIKSLDRPRAKSYFAIYEQAKNHSRLLLDFAKMDFSYLQAMHQAEARQVSLWWKNLGMSNKLPFSRDRLVECYFWVLSLYSEPCYSRARVMMTKIIAQMSALDDIYDVYGTLDELLLLTDAIERWDIESVRSLPECMQHTFKALQETFNDFDAELAPENNAFRLEYLKKELINVAKGYLQEAKWANQFYVPKLEEHLNVTVITAGYSFLTCASYVGMKEMIPKDLFDWVTSLPEIIKASCLIGRLMNDIVTYELEQKRDHVASTVKCYVVEHGCSEEEACEKLMEMVENAWKTINKELIVGNKNIPSSLIWPAFKLASFNEFVYEGQDIYTNADKVMKDNITSVLVESVQINTLQNPAPNLTSKI